MIKVLSISTDRKIFEEGSAVRARMVEYASLFDELHIVVFTTRIRNPELGIKGGKMQIAENVWVYPTRSLTRWFYIFGAIRIGRRIISKLSIPNPLPFVVTCQDPFECGLVGLILSKKFKLPLHIQIHTDFLSQYFIKESFINRVRLLIAKKILLQAQAIRVVSQRIYDSLRGFGIVNYELKTSILPIFIELDKFKLNKSNDGLQTKYPQWSFVILMVARLTHEKNINFAFAVLVELLKKYPKTGLVVVGDGPLMSSLKFQATSLNLQDNVFFEGWQSDLVSYYQTANLFLQTSFYEGFGLSLLEAMASGCPAISSDVGIAPELLNHKGHSFVCSVNDLDCFVLKISELIENNQLREFFSEQIAPDAVDQFKISKNEYCKAYKESLLTALSYK